MFQGTPPLLPAAIFVAILVGGAGGIVIWRLWAELGRLRLQVAAGARERAALLAAQAGAPPDAEEVKPVSPVAWNICASCQSSLALVECPYCHAPYHTEAEGPNGGKVNCWEVVLRHGQCFNCKGDLTPFQKAYPGGVKLSPTPANGATNAHALDGEAAGGIPMVLPPRRIESPPTGRRPTPIARTPTDDDFVVMGTND